MDVVSKIQSIADAFRLWLWVNRMEYRPMRESEMPIRNRTDLIDKLFEPENENN